MTDGRTDTGLWHRPRLHSIAQQKTQFNFKRKKVGVDNILWPLFEEGESVDPLTLRGQFTPDLCFPGLYDAAYTKNTVWTLKCAIGLIVGGALQVTVVTVTVLWVES